MFSFLSCLKHSIVRMNLPVLTRTNTRTHHSFVILCLGYCRTNYSVSPTGGEYFSTDYNMVSRKKTVKYCHLVREIDRIRMRRLLLRALDFLLLSMCRNKQQQQQQQQQKSDEGKGKRSNFSLGKIVRCEMFFFLLSSFSLFT